MQANATSMQPIFWAIQASALLLRRFKWGHCESNVYAEYREQEVQEKGAFQVI